MKKLFILFLLPIAFVACNSSSEEEAGATYEEKATAAISEFTKSKEVKSVKLIQEISAEDAGDEVVKYDSAVLLYEMSIEKYNSAIESYESAKESMSKIDNTYAAYLGTAANMNYDSLIQELQMRIEENNKIKGEIMEISSQIKNSMEKNKDKTPYSVFNATVDGAQRTFAISPDGDDVKVLFEIFM